MKTGVKKTLELNTTTIQQYIRSFKLRLDSLDEFPELKPYIPVTAISPATESKAGGVSPDESRLNEDDVGMPLRRKKGGRAVYIHPYLLSQSQLDALKLLREADTLVFIALPSYDSIMKLIALYVQVTLPFFGHKVFPNVTKVVFSSKIQEKSLDFRLAKNTTNMLALPLPHPITFALDWLVYHFSLCIHSPSKKARSNWIEARIKKDKSNQSSTDLDAKYKQEWYQLGALGGTIDIEKVPLLHTISYHDILPGDKPDFAHDIDTYLHFAHYVEGDMIGEPSVTLAAIAKPLISPGNLQPNRLHLIDIEYLENPRPRKVGPKSLQQCIENRYMTATKFFLQLADSRQMEGNDLDKDADAVWLTRLIHIGGSEGSRSASCVSCSHDCKEDGCSTWIQLGSDEKDADTQSLNSKTKSSGVNMEHKNRTGW
jgi:hypothetical protein